MHFTDSVMVEPADATSPNGTLMAKPVRGLCVKKFSHSWIIPTLQSGEEGTSFAVGQEDDSAKWICELAADGEYCRAKVVRVYRNDRYVKIAYGCQVQITSFADEEMSHAIDTATVRLRMSDPWYFVHRFEDDAEEYTLLSPVIVKRIRVDITLLYLLRALTDSIGSRSTRSIVRSLTSNRGPSSVYIDLTTFADDDFRCEHKKNGDYIIQCLDGELRARKVILYTSSTYFKHRLDANPDESRRFIPYAKSQVERLVDFMHSLAFDMPCIDRIEDFGWFMKLIGLLQLQRREKVVVRARDWLAAHLDKVRSNLPALMRCLSVAYNAEFADVVIRACHIVANEHFVAFNEDYNAESVDPYIRDIVQSLAAGSSRFQYVGLDPDRYSADGWYPMQYIREIRAASAMTRISYHHSEPRRATTSVSANNTAQSLLSVLSSA
ncbi:hypothetical protein AAVH_04352 [Aphelenchoides avenae]|nr:hypothetical protein AAVH_04352 [Aphelenchus avenae]